MATRSIGIRELKTHLSRYLSEVKGGSELLISERGKSVAKIVPFMMRRDQEEMSAALLKLSKEGKIILPAVSARPSRPARRKKVKGSPFSDSVLEGRR